MGRRPLPPPLHPSPDPHKFLGARCAPYLLFLTHWAILAALAGKGSRNPLYFFTNSR
jgi:hypothetical protein